MAEGAVRIVAVGIKDVAREAEVSVATVSLAINSPERVSSESLERVRKAVDILGYVRNEAARQLRVGTSNMLGLVVLDLRNPFFTDIALGAEEEAGKNGLSVVIGNSNRDRAREASYLDLFAGQAARGIVITPSGARVRERLITLRSRGIPAILVDDVNDDDRFGSISLDNEKGGFIAVRHLIEQGRRHIVFVGTRRIPQIAQRLAGAQRAARDLLSGDLEVIETGAVTFDTCLEASQALAQRPLRDRPDAVFAANDIVATAILQAFSQRGIAVPDDVALMGFDDIFHARTAAVPLTTIRQPSREMGRESVSMLIELEQGGDTRQVRIEPELVVRQSTTCR